MGFSQTFKLLLHELCVWHVEALDPPAWLWFCRNTWYAYLHSNKRFAYWDCPNLCSMNDKPVSDIE